MKKKQLQKKANKFNVIDSMEKNITMFFFLQQHLINMSQIVFSIIY